MGNSLIFRVSGLHSLSTGEPAAALRACGNLEARSELNGKKATEGLGQRLSTTARPLAPFPALSPPRPGVSRVTGQGRGWGAGFSELLCRDLTNDRAEVQVSGPWTLPGSPASFHSCDLGVLGTSPTARAGDVGDVTWTLWAGRGPGVLFLLSRLSARRPPQRRDPTWAL